ncbi:uncharacterized protein si:ch73-204p21.2 isoform X2 [Pungitius pungitius]|uniref:uncharacterized protein si:ch73-204p21.2 isoform X2 n=1 Tax=Pungitius pungitius TaxID=134920 RepID=UPI001888159D
MAAFGPDISGSWLSTSGVVGFFILLLLLSIFLSALCSECSRRSFELKDSEVDKDPSTLIKVVKLEEGLVGTENPRINDLTDDTDLNPCDGNTYTPWRSHLVAPENQHDPNGSTAPHSVYQTMGGEGRDLTNHQPGAESSLPADGSSVYAQVQSQ